MSERFEFPGFETARLILRVLTLDDAAAVQRHFSDEEVTRHMDIDPCESVEAATEIIRFHVEDTGCRWGLFGRGTGGLIGTLGYHCWVRDEHPRAEIGYDLGRAHWGRGLMREAMDAAIEFGFGPMGLESIEAEVEPENVRSIGLLERLGFRSDPEERPGGLWFRLVPDDWDRAR